MPGLAPSIFSSLGSLGCFGSLGLVVLPLGCPRFFGCGASSRGISCAGGAGCARARLARCEGGLSGAGASLGFALLFSPVFRVRPFDNS